MMRAHYDFCIFLGTAQNEVERTTVFQSTLLAPPPRRPLQIISRNAQTTSQKEEEGGGGGVRLPTSVARMLKNMMMLRQEEENAMSLTPNLGARFRLADHQRRRFNLQSAVHH